MDQSPDYVQPWEDGQGPLQAGYFLQSDFVSCGSKPNPNWALL